MYCTCAKNKQEDYTTGKSAHTHICTSSFFVSSITFFPLHFLHLSFCRIISPEQQRRGGQHSTAYTVQLTQTPPTPHTMVHQKQIRMLNYRKILSTHVAEMCHKPCPTHGEACRSHLRLRSRSRHSASAGPYQGQSV